MEMVMSQYDKNVEEATGLIKERFPEITNDVLEDVSRKLVKIVDSYNESVDKSHDSPYAEFSIEDAVERIDWLNVEGNITAQDVVDRVTEIDEWNHISYSPFIDDGVEINEDTIKDIGLSALEQYSSNENIDNFNKLSTVLNDYLLYQFAQYNDDWVAPLQEFVEERYEEAHEPQISQKTI